MNDFSFLKFGRQGSSAGPVGQRPSVGRLVFDAVLIGALWKASVAAFPGYAAAPVLRVRPMPPAGMEISWQPGGGETDRAMVFELQSSDDLKNWGTEGEPVLGTSSDVLHLRSLEADGVRRFYRLRAIARAGVHALGQGGAEVFGYSDRLAEVLPQIGPISAQGLAERFPAPATYLERISFDPTLARYWEDFSADPEAADSAAAAIGDRRRYDFRLDARELEVFRRNGFVVSERLSTASFAGMFYRLWMDDLPVYISTDAILQAWHRTYDSLLEEMEEVRLALLLEAVLKGMAGEVEGMAVEVGAGPLRESLRDADYVLSVGLSLLLGRPVAGALGQEDRIAAALRAVENQRLLPCFDLFGAPRAVDFSQFKIRGHYENSPRLGRYFQAVMWLGRVDLRIGGGPYMDSGCGGWHHAPVRELGTAVVLDWLLQRSGQFPRWQEFEAFLTGFVGWTDSLNFGQLHALVAAAGLRGPGEVATFEVLSALQRQIEDGAYGTQEIVADWFASPLGAGQVRLPQSFTLFGQKFTPDSWALGQLVYDRVLFDVDGVPEAGDKVPRRVPSALDVAFAVLGNDQVMPEILARIQDRSETRHPWRDGLPYQQQLAAVRAVLDAQRSTAWEDNLLVDWLGTLRALSQPVHELAGYPEAMRTRAWAMKSLNTQLASWTQLRHDTVLYSKQSYTSGIKCAFPAAFVECHPTFWNRLVATLERARALIERWPLEGKTPVRGPSGPGSERLVDLSGVQRRQLLHLDEFRRTLRQLEACSRRMQDGMPLTESQSFFLCDLIERKTPDGCGGPRRFNGWYPRLFYANVFDTVDTPDGGLAVSPAFQTTSGSDKYDAIAVDVHTDPPDPSSGDPGSVLHEAIGNVNLLMLAAHREGEAAVFAGPVLSHFEFEMLGPPRRLSDSDWRLHLSPFSPGSLPSRPAWRDYPNFELATSIAVPGRAPPPPPWTASYLVPAR